MWNGLKEYCRRDCGVDCGSSETEETEGTEEMKEVEEEPFDYSEVLAKY
jgi:hypothetical protein